MAMTDARTGFRLPWSPDQRPATDEAEGDSTSPAGSDRAPIGQPQASPVPDGHAAPRATGRKPTKFLADLVRAMQTAAEAAREESLTRLHGDAKAHVEELHVRSADEAAGLRRRADDDVAAIREWSKAEIARIREETEARVVDRKGRLETEIEEHAALIERRVEAVHGRVTGFEQEMAAFFERLLAEEDPTRFAELAGNLPEPPAFDDEPAAEDAVEASSAETEAAAVTEEAAPEGEDEPSTAEVEPADEPALPSGSESESATGQADPRIAALGLTPDFAAAEAEAFAAVDAAEEIEVPTIADDALAVRLAGLVPVGENGRTSSEPQGTRVVVNGLVSVASIAGFKRHLARLTGVQSVGVSSGPDGEFVFTVAHAAATDLVAAIPALPQFNARVTGRTDGVVEVAAHDPESPA